MKRMYIITAIGTAIIASCNSGANNSSNNVVDTVIAQTPAPPVNVTSPSGCYLMSLKKDSASLNIEIKDSVVNGDLNYLFFQKDANLGTINGTWKDSMIRAFYTFRSEGVISVREVAWKIKDNELWPAFGNVTQRNDTVFFAKPDLLQFDSMHPFVKIACKL